MAKLILLVQYLILLIAMISFITYNSACEFLNGGLDKSIEEMHKQTKVKLVNLSSCIM